MIKRLDWDSDFFSLEIGSTFDVTTLLDNYTNFDLVYSIFNTDNKLVSNFFQSTFSEIKVVFQKELQLIDAIETANIKSIKNTNYKIEELYELAYESGKHSRFKLDKRFSEDKFRTLYKAWVDNSIQNGFADEIFIYHENNKSLGFVTIKINGINASIGLIAVSANAQGIGIGKQLIYETERYLLGKNVSFLNIPTQLNNHQACGFYKKMGYKIFETTYINHYWKNEK